MGFHQSNNSFTLTTIVIIFCVWGFLREIQAMRPLEGEQWLKKHIFIQSLQRGPVPSSSSNPCTYIPGGKPRGRCTLAENEINFAGATGQVESPAAFPQVMVHFGAATATATASSSSSSSLSSSKL